MIDLLLLLFGLLGLWIGTELALRNTIELAERHGLSHGFLGLTVLAIGTDLPELVVAITGGIRQLQGLEASGVVVGNAMGSAITQGSLVLGVAGLLGTLSPSREVVRKDGLVLGLSVIVLALLAGDGRIDRLEGGVLILVYLVYSARLVRSERARAGRRAPARGTGRNAIGIAGGLVLVPLSAELVVSNAVALTERWSLDQTLLGVLLVGAGTSLPELALSFGAAAKRRPDLSVGNVIGSNTFDLLVPIGTSAALHPLSIQRSSLTIDLPVLALVVVLGIALLLRRGRLHRTEAIALVSIWAAFVVARLALHEPPA